MEVLDAEQQGAVAYRRPKRGTSFFSRSPNTPSPQKTMTPSPQKKIVAAEPDAPASPEAAMNLLKRIQSDALSALDDADMKKLERRLDHMEPIQEGVKAWQARARANSARYSQRSHKVVSLARKIAAEEAITAAAAAAASKKEQAAGKLQAVHRGHSARKSVEAAASEATVARRLRMGGVAFLCLFVSVLALDFGRGLAIVLRMPPPPLPPPAPPAPPSPLSLPSPFPQAPPQPHLLTQRAFVSPSPPPPSPPCPSSKPPPPHSPSKPPPPSPFPPPPEPIPGTPMEPWTVVLFGSICVGSILMLVGLACTKSCLRKLPLHDDRHAAEQVMRKYGLKPMDKGGDSSYRELSSGPYRWDVRSYATLEEQEEEEEESKPIPPRVQKIFDKFDRFGSSPERSPLIATDRH